MNALEEFIHQKIATAGPVSFARFMELALYHPLYGYYERRAQPVGRQGDFFTSVTVGSLFGELLGFQFVAWLKAVGPGPSQIVEAGAHDGRLAADILNFLKTHQPGLLERVDYWLIEPSAHRQRWQQQTLDQFAAKVRWFDSLAALPASGVRGVIFSNELLDAMPVHRLGW